MPATNPINPPTMTNGIIRSQVSRRAARLAHSFIGATGVTSANLRASETKNNTQKIKYPDSCGLIGSLCCMRLKPHSAKLTSGVLLSRITSAITGHEREPNHFTPARMSAPCASHCYHASETSYFSVAHTSLVQQEHQHKRCIQISKRRGIEACNRSSKARSNI